MIYFELAQCQSKNLKIEYRLSDSLEIITATQPRIFLPYGQSYGSGDLPKAGLSRRKIRGCVAFVVSGPTTRKVRIKAMQMQQTIRQ